MGCFKIKIIMEKEVLGLKIIESALSDSAFLYELKCALVNAKEYELAAELRRLETGDAPRYDELLDALKYCQKALLMLVSPDAIRQTTVSHAWASATDAESLSRKLIERIEAINKDADNG